MQDVPFDLLDKVNLFFRELGKNGLFTKDDLKINARIRSGKYLSGILKFLEENKIVKRVFWICPKCGFDENKLEENVCENCGYVKPKEVEFKYELIANIPMTPKEKDYEKLKLKEYDRILFKHLFAKLKKAEKDKTKHYVAFLDIANSTKLQKKDRWVSTQLRTWLRENAISLSYRHLFKFELGHYLKSMGDAVYIFSFDIEPLIKIILKIFKSLENIDEYKKANRIIEPNFIYLKAYVASSAVLKPYPSDELSLDLDMEAFTFIARIEKEVQKKLKAKLTTSDLGFVVLRDKINGDVEELELSNIKDYADIRVYYKIIPKSL